MYKEELVTFCEQQLPQLTAWADKAAIFRLLSDIILTLNKQLNEKQIGRF